MPLKYLAELHLVRLLNRNLPEWAKFAGYVLALYGLLGLLVLPGRWLYNMAAMRDVAGFARPICERYPFDPTDETSLYNSREAALLGVQILAQKSIVRPRIRFSHVLSVQRWGLYSDGLSDVEIASYLAQLQLEGMPNEFVTPPLPSLPADSSTTLVMIARPLDIEFCRDPHWFTVLSEGGVGDVPFSVESQRWRPLNPTPFSSSSSPRRQVPVPPVPR